MAKFTRRVPFGIMADWEASDSLAFDSYPVEVAEKYVNLCRVLREINETMEKMHLNMPAPEVCAQQEADFLVNQLASAMEGLRNGTD